MKKSFIFFSIIGMGLLLQSCSLFKGKDCDCPSWSQYHLQPSAPDTEKAENAGNVKA